MKARLAYSIKYDLGGALDPADVDEDEFVGRLRTAFPGVRRCEDLPILNLSYLSRTFSIYALEVEWFEFKGRKWRQHVLVDPKGVITFDLLSDDLEHGQPEELAAQLLAMHEAFLQDKNRDYLLYLSRLGELRGRLRHVGYPDGAGVFEFRHHVARIRACLAGIEGRRPRYNFHDYRPIFILDDAMFEHDRARGMLLALAADAGNLAVHGNADASVQRFLGCTRSYVCRAGAWTVELQEMFSHAHSTWFQIHASIFEMRGVEELMTRRLANESHGDADDIQEFVRYLRQRKNAMLSEMLAALNSDFVTKSSLCLRDLDMLNDQFGVQHQIDILQDYTERIGQYVRDQGERLRLLQARNLSRTTRAIEFLFFLNTATGIASFIPMFFSSDIHDKAVWDFPRRTAISTLVIVLMLYAALFLLTRWRQPRPRQVEQAWLRTLSIDHRQLDEDE